MKTHLKYLYEEMKKMILLENRMPYVNNKGADQPAHAQADLSLRWAHTHFVGFAMSQLIYRSYLFL